MAGGGDRHDRCAECGTELSAHDRHVRFTVPDVLVGRELRPSATWMSHRTPGDSVQLQVQDVGAFVRALVPVRLTGGFAVTFGVWVAVDPADLRRAFDVSLRPAYVDLVLDGRLANAIPGWDVVGAQVRLEVRDPDHTPYCVSSTAEPLQEILDGIWPHRLVLG